MDAFEQALMRLKQRLGVRTDKRVAEALGMTPAALNERKKRGSFPADKLRAAAQLHPEWGLDVDYVLTGDSDVERRFASAADALRDATSRAQRLPLGDRERVLVRDVLWAVSTDRPDMVGAFIDDYYAARRRAELEAK